MNKKVSIILVNYNWLKFNKSCIESIFLQTYKNFEIVFVDNASTDWSLEEVEKIFAKEILEKKIIVVKNKNNEWFSNWNNIGHQNSSKDSEYVCMLNNDTTLPTDWLEKLVDGIESDKSLWAVWSVILDKWYENKIKEKIFEKKKIVTSSLIWESVWKDISENEFKKWIFYTSVLSGCCLMYRKEIVEYPFPPFYFAYAEDFFLSRLILLKWYKMAVVWNSFVYHAGSWSFGKKPSNMKLFYGNRNQILNFILFYNLWTKLKLLPLFLITQVAHLWINVPFKRLNAKVKARIWIIRHKGEIKNMRAYIIKQSRISHKELLNNLSYKFNDEVFFAQQKKWQIILIKIVNELFKHYCQFWDISK